MRELSGYRHELVIYPRGFRWCVREAARLALIAGLIVLVSRVLGFWS